MNSFFGLSKAYASLNLSADDLHVPIVKLNNTLSFTTSLHSELVLKHENLSAFVESIGLENRKFNAIHEIRSEELIRSLQIIDIKADLDNVKQAFNAMKADCSLDYQRIINEMICRIETLLLAKEC